MFIEVQRSHGRRALLAIDKIVSFLETEDGTCQIIVNLPTADSEKRGSNRAGAGIFTVQCVDSYDSIVQLIRAQVIHSSKPVPAAPVQRELFDRRQ